MIDLSLDGLALSIEAVPRVPGVESVVFTLDGIDYRVENSDPYALGGDVRGSDYLPVQALTQVGRHLLTATAYSENGGRGMELVTAEITFEVVP